MKKILLTFIAIISLPITQLAQKPIICSEKEQIIKDSPDPRIIKSCTFENFKSVSIGDADYKGRYSYSYKLLKLINNRYVEIKNSELFNENKKELLAIINQKIKETYDEYSNNSETKDCFDGFTLTEVSFDDLGISFNDTGIDFSISFGLSGACLSVDGTIISIELAEIKVYLNKN